MQVKLQPKSFLLLYAFQQCHHYGLRRHQLIERRSDAALGCGVKIRARRQKLLEVERLVIRHLEHAA
jgi:hypothetical protein